MDFKNILAFYFVIKLYSKSRLIRQFYWMLSTKRTRLLTQSDWPTISDIKTKKDREGEPQFCPEIFENHLSYFRRDENARLSPKTCTNVSSL